MVASLERAAAAHRHVVAGFVLFAVHLASASVRRWANASPGVMSWQLIAAVFVGDMVESMAAVPAQRRPAA